MGYRTNFGGRDAQLTAKIDVPASFRCSSLLDPPGSRKHSKWWAHLLYFAISGCVVNYSQTKLEA